LKIRILFIIPQLSREGPVHALLSIIKGFCELNEDEVTLLTLNTPERNEMLSEFSQLGISILSIPVRPLTFLLDIIKIRRFIIRGNFHVAASTCVRADAALAISLFGINTIRIVTTVQNIPLEDLAYLYPGWKGRFFAWGHYQILRFFQDGIISCSDVVGEHLKKRLGVKANKIFNPVSSDFGEYRPLDFKTPKIVLAASLTHRKNPMEAISFVFNALPSSSFALEVYGKGMLETELRSVFGGRSEMNMLGFSDNLGAVFSAANIYISSSYSEGFPLTAQLALVNGCPCVLSNIPQHVELAKLSDYVYLYTLGDSSSFSLALKAALSADRLLIYDAGKKLRAQISPRSIAKNIQSFYNSLRGFHENTL
jgi:glycosyltransferase involved in cell wall biosynthesis